MNPARWWTPAFLTARGKCHYSSSFFDRADAYDENFPEVFTTDTLIGFGSLNSAMADFIRACVIAPQEYYCFRRDRLRQNHGFKCPIRLYPG